MLNTPATLPYTIDGTKNIIVNIGTNPFISGEWSIILPVSAFLSIPFWGIVSTATNAINAKKVKLAIFNAFCSFLLNSFKELSSLISFSKECFDNLGSTILSVINQPRPVIKKVDTIMKNIFAVGDTT